MTPTRQGSFRLFRFAGITVYLHWSWFLLAAYELYGGRYKLPVWNALEYLALFAIVLMHEFGHSLACRQVGGQADQIVLWPLGGVAYVNPPQRPGATLWSIAAGPLVNVILFPILSVFLVFSQSLHWGGSNPDLFRFVEIVWWINLGLLIFNLLPIYPLDGGQIFRSLLWFVVGRARSLMVATIVGFVGVGLLLLVALWLHSNWIIILAVFMLLNCWGGLMHARMLARAENAPRHGGFACPKCGTAPPQGPFWICGRCRKGFDTFDTNAACPYCGAQFGATLCLECGEMFPVQEWAVAPFSQSPPAPPFMQPPRL